MNQMKITLLLIAVFVSGCMTVRKINYNGEELFEVKCNGTARTMADCLEKSSEHCASLGKKSVPMDRDGNSSIVSMNGQILPAVSRSLLFKCEGI